MSIKYYTTEEYVNKAIENLDISGSPAGSVSWNDLTDKPFYEEEQTIEVFANRTVNCSNEYDGVYWCYDTSVPALIRGDNYTVIWDGEEYQCIATDDGYGGNALGNIHMAGMPDLPDTGEPFFIYETYSSDGYYGLCAVSSGEHTLSILHHGMAVHPLDAKYLPDIEWHDIANRPFYKDVQLTLLGEAVDVETAFSREDSFAARGDISGANIQCDEYETNYMAEFDGALYEVKLTKVYSNIYVFGNFGLYYDNPESDDGMPFAVLLGSNSSPTLYTRESGTHTFRLYKSRVDFKALDTEFLPEGYPKVSYTQKSTLVDNVVIDASESYYIEDVFDVDLVMGQTYTVIYDGNTYECECFDYNGNPTIGDWYTTGYDPFVIFNTNAGTTDIETAKRGSHTITIKGVREVVTPMDEKFLPTTAALKSDVGGIVKDLAFANAKTIQSDWNEIRQDKLSYINNKPFVDEKYLRLEDIKNGSHYVLSIEDGKLMTRFATQSINIVTPPTDLTMVEGGAGINLTGISVEAILENGEVIVIDESLLECEIVDDATCMIIYREAGKAFISELGYTLIDIETALADFSYSKQDDGTYMLTGWNKSSGDMIIPNSKLIVL